jgi:hypothetical protein
MAASRRAPDRQTMAADASPNQTLAAWLSKHAHAAAAVPRHAGIAVTLDENDTSLSAPFLTRHLCQIVDEMIADPACLAAWADLIAELGIPEPSDDSNSTIDVVEVAVERENAMLVLRTGLVGEVTHPYVGPVLIDL